MAGMPSAHDTHGSGLSDYIPRSASCKGTYKKLLSPQAPKLLIETPFPRALLSVRDVPCGIPLLRSLIQVS